MWLSDFPELPNIVTDSQYAGVVLYIKTAGLITGNSELNLFI